MSQYSLEDLRSTSVDEFRMVPTGSYTINRNGRRVPVTEGVHFVTTKVGKMTDDEWYQALEEAVVREGKEQLLEAVIASCRKLAWLKTEKAVRRHALSCLSSGAYLHWPEWKKE